MFRLARVRAVQMAGVARLMMAAVSVPEGSVP
jgi:hypothetical protein